MPYDWPHALLSLDPVKLFHLGRPALACKYGRKRETVLWLTSGPMTWHCIHCMDQSERASHSYTMVMTANCFCAARENPSFSVLGVCDCFMVSFVTAAFFFFYTDFQSKTNPHVSTTSLLSQHGVDSILYSVKSINVSRTPHLDIFVLMVWRKWRDERVSWCSASKAWYFRLGHLTSVSHSICYGGIIWWKVKAFSGQLCMLILLHFNCKSFIYHILELVISL